MQEITISALTGLLTAPEFAALHREKATVRQVRSWIWRARPQNDPRHEGEMLPINGLGPAIIRIQGWRGVLLYEPAVLEWLETGKIVEHVVSVADLAAAACFRIEAASWRKRIGKKNGNVRKRTTAKPPRRRKRSGQPEDALSAAGA